VWDARTGTAQRELKAIPLEKRAGWLIAGAAFSPDGTRIVSGGEGNSARVCDTTTGEVRLELKGHTLPVICASFSPDGMRIVTGSANGEVKLWDAQKGTELFGLKAHAGVVSNVAFSLDGKRIITGAQGDFPNRSAVKIWEVPSAKPEEVAEKREKALLEINVLSREQNIASFSPDGTRIIVGGGDRVTVRDAHSGAVLFELNDRIRGAGLSYVWDGSTGSGVQSASFSPDGTRIVTAGGRSTAGDVTVWDARTGAELLELKGPQAR
jgi:WD40 repeat protein